jgi:predicted phage terminase large subunit-like protein
LITEEVSVQSILREIRETEAEVARRSNLTFTLFTNPDYIVNWHHRKVADALDRVLAGKCRRLMIFEPPQNGKSEQVSRRFPAYALGKNPNLRIVACSYSMSLAEDMSRDVQKIIDSDEYQELFPNTRLATSRDIEKRTQGQFDVVGHRGYYKAAGVDGSITGKTADIGIIDDPVKNREEAESEVYQEKVWNFYKSAFATRQFGDTGSIILCTTRWHTKDLAGRLLALAQEDSNADQWEVICLQAIAEEDEEFRAKGEALWPEKYPLEELARRRAMLGSYDWSALYQQKPTPSGGGLFKAEWFAGRFVDAGPAIARRTRGWDTAGTEKDGDWTVGVRIAEEFVERQAPGTTDTELVSTGRFFIEDVRREQLGPAGVDGLIRVTAETDGINVAQREEKEGGSAGVAVVTARAKTLVGFDYKEVQISGSKVTRSKPFRAQCEAGNVYIVRGPWNAAYIGELTQFPNGDHDDQVDGSSCAFNTVLLEPVPEKEWVTW